jgi:EAL domain-containing protein (putative c-di-GMP-specific phosphodiesterase class I)
MGVFSGGRMTVSRDAPSLVDRLIDQREVRTVFQPLVHLQSLEVVGFEALSRGPGGSDLEAPIAFMAAADAAGRLEELDWACAANAVQAANTARLNPSLTVFINLEPSTLATPCPLDLVPTMARARENLRVVVEMGERSLLDDPSSLLDGVAAVRQDGWGVAIDRVGGDLSALALLPFIKPDVVKVSLPLLKAKGHDGWAETANVARAYAEHSGAVILVSGVESDEDAWLARAFGATYGQGWRYGHPGPLPADAKVPWEPFPLLQGLDNTRGATPFEIVAERREPETGDRHLLRHISNFLEDQAPKEPPVVVLSCLGHARHLSGATLERYRRIGASAIFAGVLAEGLTPEMAPAGARATPLHPRDRLCQEWDVLVVSPHFTGALVAREHDDGSGEPHQHFDYAVTYDRSLVVTAARALLHWVTGQGGPRASGPR